MHTDVFSLKVYRLLVQNQDISVKTEYSAETLKDFGSVVIMVLMQDPVWWLCKTGTRVLVYR